jgi:hypothetical protein
MDESFPRYGLSGDREVVQASCFGEGTRYERPHSYLAGVAVDLDAEAEGVVDRVAQVGIRGSKLFAEIWNRAEQRACFGHSDRASLACSVVGIGERRGLPPFGFEVAVTLMSG